MLFPLAMALTEFTLILCCYKLIIDKKKPRYVIVADYLNQSDKLVKDLSHTDYVY